MVEHGYYEYGGLFSSPWTVDNEKAFKRKGDAEDYIKKLEDDRAKGRYSSDSKFYIEEIEVE